MAFLFYTLIIIIILSLALLLYFLFFVLLPSIKSDISYSDDSDIPNDNNKSDPVFSNIERNYVIPKEDFVPVSEKRAFVMCSAEKSFKCEKTSFNEGQSCLVVHSMFKSGNDCQFSCLGLGDCAKACPQNAISIKNNTAIVTNLCVGCGFCVGVCPKGIIKMITKNTKTQAACSNTDADDSLTTCSHLKKEENVVRADRKGFKIWEQCYKLLKPKK